MKILISDDHALMREGIRTVLARLPDQPDIVDATNFDETIKAIAEHPDLDAILLDLGMPGDKPASGLQRVLEHAAGIPVAVLSASEDTADMQRSIALGARAYIPKADSKEIMLSALQLVLSGGTYIPPGLLTGAATLNPTASPDATKPDSCGLTRRQQEVLGLLALGKSNKEIGNELGLSEGTVRTHLVRIFRQLGVNNRTQASIKARELGISKAF